MTANWYDGYQKELALERLQDRFPGKSIEVIDTFDIAWSSWECDSQGALISLNGKPKIVVVDAVGIDDPLGPLLLRERISEYRRLIGETEAVLEKYRSLGGLEGAAFLEAEGLEHMRDNARVRRQDETNEDYAARLKLWNLEPPTATDPASALLDIGVEPGDFPVRQPARVIRENDDD